MDKNRKNRAMTLSLDPLIQSFIQNMYIIFEDSSLPSSWENCDTYLALKDITRAPQAGQYTPVAQ